MPDSDAPRRRPRDHRPPGGTAGRRHPPDARGRERARSPLRRGHPRGDHPARSRRRDRRARARRSRPRWSSTTATATTPSPTRSSRTRSTTASPRPAGPGSIAPRPRPSSSSSRTTRRSPRSPYHYCRALPAGDRARAVDYACRAGADAAERGASEQAVQHFERAREAAAGGDGGALDAGRAGPHCCATSATRTTTPARPRPRRRRTRRPSSSPSAATTRSASPASVLGLMGGVDESVGFNLTGTDGALVAMLDDIRVRLPEDATQRSARSSPRGSPARATTRGDVETRAGAEHRSARPRAASRRRARDRDRARACVTPRCRVRRRSTTGCELDEELRALGRSFSVQAEVWRVGDLLECGRLAEADAAMEEMDERAARAARSRARRGTPRCTGRCARRSTVASTTPARRCEEARAIGAAGRRAHRPGVSYAVQSLFVARERRELDGLVEVLDALADEHPHQPGFLTTAAWVRIETGRFDEARRPVRRDRRRRLRHRSCATACGCANMRLLSEIAYAVDDARTRGARCTSCCSRTGTATS